MTGVFNSKESKDYNGDRVRVEGEGEEEREREGSKCQYSCFQKGGSG